MKSISTGKFVSEYTLQQLQELHRQASESGVWDSFNDRMNAEAVAVGLPKPERTVSRGFPAIVNYGLNFTSREVLRAAPDPDQDDPEPRKEDEYETEPEHYRIEQEGKVWVLYAHRDTCAMAEYRTRSSAEAAMRSSIRLNLLWMGLANMSKEIEEAVRVFTEKHPTHRFVDIFQRLYEEWGEREQELGGEKYSKKTVEMGRDLLSRIATMHTSDGSEVYCQERMTKLAIRKRVLTAIADTLEGMGVREIISILGPEPVDQAAIREAFDAAVREIRAKAASKRRKK